MNNLGSGILGGLRSIVTGQRVLLAAKTALAAGIAWWLAPSLPAGRGE